MSDPVGALVLLCDDLMLVTLSQEGVDEAAWNDMAKRREGAAREAGRSGVIGASAGLTGDVEGWVEARAVDLAAVAPPAWLPMGEVVASGITLAAGARGVRSLFSSKPSEKEVARVTRLGTLAFRALGAAVSADGEPTRDERFTLRVLLSSLGLAPDDTALLAASAPGDVTALEIHGEIEPKVASLILRGAWQAALRDGLDAREEGAMAILAGRLGVKPEEAAQARVAVEQATEARRLFGRAVIDTFYWLLGDDLGTTQPAARTVAALLLPDPERAAILAALDQGAPPATVERAPLPRTARAGALAAGWLLALRSNPTATRRAVLGARHSAIASALDGDGAKMRELVERHVGDRLLQVAIDLKAGQAAG